MNTSTNTVKTKTVKVWDPIVRVGHWLLALAFFTAYFTEDDFMTPHVYAGYLAGAIVGIRVLWGLIGPRHARFSDFVASWRVTLGYIRDMLTFRATRYLGHNPAAGVMILALLSGVAGTVVSGTMLYAIEDGKGPMASWVANAAPATGNLALIAAPVFADDNDEHDVVRGGAGRHKESAGEEFWEETHEIFANLTLLLVGLHIAGVLFSSFTHRENLIKGMFTGRKSA